MTVFFDNNIILDALAARKPWNSAAEALLIKCAKGEFDGCISVNSATDILYVAAKYIGANAARNAVERLLDTIYAAPLTHDDCLRAFRSPMGDYEDALLAICAENSGADCIVTRDAGFLAADCGVRVVTPEGLLGEMDV